MSLDLYIESPSMFHRLDPRTKGFLLLATFLLLLVEGSSYILLFLLGLILLQGGLSGTLGLVRRFWLLLTSVFALAALTKGIPAGLKMDGMILSGIFFLATTRQEEILQGLVKLGLPFVVGFALTLAVRMVPVLAESAETVILAQRSRGLTTDRGSILQRIRSHLPLLVPILVTAIRGANLLSWALEARGFGAEPRRTSYLELRWSAADFFMILLTFVLIIFLFLLKSHWF
ncbi:MAG TPA: energy-coupling factor transporter transmembrane component T [Nitrospiria bacterium]|nr:energy-coupling factor transporter transmembrane component T [Nitrospiria bacterium]